jgi:hypothetical protein
MDTRCPECDAILDLLEGDEMGSKPRRYLRQECQIMFETRRVL